MSNINILISVSREQQIAIEEYCTNYSKTPSEYFIGLHEEFQRTDDECAGILKATSGTNILIKKSPKEACERKKSSK